MKVPKGNCKTPRGAKTCHFWGDPHFTHVFNQKTHGRNYVRKGGRHRHGRRLFNFNPSGVFDLASSKDGSFEAQVFFCPYISKTSTGAGVAMRFGDDIIQVVRGLSTKPTSENRKDNRYFATLTNEKGRQRNDEHTFTEFFVNGVQNSWEDLGEAKGTRGMHVRRSRGKGGVATGSAFLRQLRTTHENWGTITPVCAGDGDHNLVEVGIPYLRGSRRWPMVYEQAITIRSNDAGSSGICAGDVKSIPRSKDSYRVNPKKNLFSSKQMKDLCGMCRLSMKDGVCGAPSHDVSAAEVCKSAGADIAAAKKECRAEFDEDDDWFDICVMETCATGDGAVAISKIEEHLQEEEENEEEEEEGEGGGEVDSTEGLRRPKGKRARKNAPPRKKKSGRSKKFDPRKGRSKPKRGSYLLQRSKEIVNVQDNQVEEHVLADQQVDEEGSLQGDGKGPCNENDEETQSDEVKQNHDWMEWGDEVGMEDLAQ